MDTGTAKRGLGWWDVLSAPARIFCESLGILLDAKGRAQVFAGVTSEAAFG